MLLLIISRDVYAGPESRGIFSRFMPWIVSCMQCGIVRVQKTILATSGKLYSSPLCCPRSVAWSQLKMNASMIVALPCTDGVFNELQEERNSRVDNICATLLWFQCFNALNIRHTPLIPNLTLSQQSELSPKGTTQAFEKYLQETQLTSPLLVRTTSYIWSLQKRACQISRNLRVPSC